MKKYCASIFLSFLFLTLFVKEVIAASSYVLPYPGIMPGNKLYKVEKILDWVKKYFLFGDFAQYKYSISLSSKKLVEAKTLFEYKQYVFAISALNESDKEFVEANKYLLQAREHKKDIAEKLREFNSAAQKHDEVLEKVLINVPATYSWSEEKKEPVELFLKEKIERSIDIRKIYE